MERQIGQASPCYGRRLSRHALALIDSKVAALRVRRMRLAAGLATPAQGGFPYPARTCAEWLPSGQAV